MRAQQTAQGQQEEALVQDVATRWNSALEMIKRIQQNKGPLAATRAQHKINISMLIAPELAKLEKLEKLLEPCMGDCPLNWWSDGQQTHEKLAGIANKHLSTPATTVPCERLFSLLGHIVQKRRASLAAENGGERVFVLRDSWQHFRVGEGGSSPIREQLASHHHQEVPGGSYQRGGASMFALACPVPLSMPFVKLSGQKG
ncbi:unnamed protein product [Pleuronectes platessa]|uniref:HAT C-terminal dimerisation domain-containing protein n=1 Tax=Pleuronectes platessa TaxID=8262 RepID=A0A9N7TUI8_PLEPL|nr:unnamed protein product [Pleuronectes platessa]